MKYPAILFDLDGTLLDTLQDIADSANAALATLGFPQNPVEAYRYFVGDGREVLAVRALPEVHRDASTASKLVALMDQGYAIHWADHTNPYQGIPEMLDALNARGIKMAVLSNKAHEATQTMVSRMLSRWRFEVVQGATPLLPKKPDPTAALHIAGQMGISPSGFLYLGDSDIDMKTATAAGMYPVGALWGFRTASELRAGGAKALLERPGDLLALL